MSCLFLSVRRRISCNYNRQASGHLVSIFRIREGRQFKLATSLRAKSKKTNLFQNRLHRIVKHHGLVSRRRKHAIEAICLVAQRVRPHGELNHLALDAVRVDHHGAVLLDLSLAAATTPHHDVDVGFFSSSHHHVGLKVALLALRPSRRRRHGRLRGRYGARPIASCRCEMSTC